MRRSLALWSALGSGFLLSVGCGSATPIDFFDAVPGGSGGASDRAGAGNVAGASGTTLIAGAGQPGAGSAGAPVIAAGAPCGPSKEGQNMMSGPFGTTGPYCLRVAGDITGWGCSNFEGRTMKVNRTDVTCGQLPLPKKFEGAYYFDVSAGSFDYASLYWYQ